VFDASDNSELASVEFKLRVNAAVFLRPRTSTSESTPRRPVVAAASDDRKITFLSLDGRGSIVRTYFIILHLKILTVVSRRSCS
jgi:hypothetical protein